MTPPVAIEPVRASGGLIESRRMLPRVRSLDELSGLDEVKTELRAQVRLWADPGALSRLGGAPRSGMLFVGPTGTGKTTAANALAAETGRPLYSFAGPDFHDTDGKDLLATVLSAAAREPAVVFIDEADDLVHVRDFRREASESLVKYLLVGLDRTTRDIAAFVVLATNLEPDDIDPALCHPGRLGRPITFRRLDAAERLELLRRTARRFALDERANLELIATRLEGMPTASVAHVLDEAAFVAWRRDATRIDDGDLDEAVARLRVGLPRARAMSGDEVRGAAVHEAGHALVAIALAGNWRAVAFVSIDARAEGQIGSTTSETDDDTIHSEAWVRRQLAVSLAGREAERLLLGTADTGSASDLAATNALAARAINEWGFSRRGARTAPKYPESRVEARVDDAAALLIREAEADARAVLEEHRGALETLAERLGMHRRATSGDLRTWLAGLLPADTGEDPR
jgi:cell division protease FtsH